MCVRAGQGQTFVVVVSQRLSTLFVETAFLIGLGFTLVRQGKLPSELLGSACLCLHWTKTTIVSNRALLFKTWVLGTEFRHFAHVSNTFPPELPL